MRIHLDVYITIGMGMEEESIIFFHAPPQTSHSV